MTAPRLAEAAPAAWLDPAEVEALLAAPPPDRARVAGALARARALEGLALPEVAALLRVQDPEDRAAVLAAAREVKEAIYGPRIVLFAPLYVSNVCSNACTYCAFRAGNDLPRRTLSAAEVRREAEALVAQGHKRVLLVAGESPARGYLDGVLEAIEAVYAARTARGEIRRVNVNLAPLDVPSLRRLRAAHIGTYQVFQETYHRPTYAAVHPRGPKADFDGRVTVMDRAQEAGIDDVGMGVLLGLYDWRFDVLSLLQHVAHLEARFGVGPHTLSVPRLEPAAGSALAAHPPHRVSDDDFELLVAVLRLAVPYTGLILSTRETAEVRRRALALGVSQISAGSRTDVGGYAAGARPDDGQFQLGDHRPLAEVVRDLAALGYVPSFCTACYRLGRTGQDFMDLAKPGAIKNHCDPNALSTLCEYLRDFGDEATAAAGRQLVEARLRVMGDRPRRVTRTLLARVEAGARDVCV